jgi:hypothetical protein
VIIRTHRSCRSQAATKPRMKRKHEWSRNNHGATCCTLP